MNLIFYIGVYCLFFVISLFFWFDDQMGKHWFDEQSKNWIKRIGVSLVIAALGTGFAYVNIETIWK